MLRPPSTKHLCIINRKTGLPRRKSRFTPSIDVIVFATSVFLGVLFALLIRKTLLGSFYLCLSGDDIEQERDEALRLVGMNTDKLGLSSNKNLVFIGIITADQYLNTRVPAVFQTWLKTIPGKAAVFAREGAVQVGTDIPIIRLPGTDDSYPPQKKSFMALKYMYDHYLNHFEYFIRTDDDVYMRTERLEVFLRSVNSSKLRYIGQMGKGTVQEFGLLSLLDDENYCMGGPGMILSRSTLARVGPHIGECLRTMYTDHEDVEVGRCVQKFAGIPCTWSYEVRSN